MNDEEFEWWRKVSQTAHELRYMHGWTAGAYAAKVATDALAEGRAEEYEFWKTVAVSLQPR